MITVYHPKGGRLNKNRQILFVSTSYPKDKRDWRGRFIANIIEALSRHDSVRLKVWTPPGKLPVNAWYVCLESEADWLSRLMAKGGIAHIMRSKKAFAFGTIFSLLHRLRKLYKREAEDCHVAHVNWLQNVLPLWGTSTPAVVTVLGNDLGLLNLPGMKFALRQVIRQRACVIAPNADWMVSKLNPVFGDIAKIQPVPFGVDDVWFRINRDPFTDRKRIWLSITRLTRKKIGTLFEWGQGRFSDSDELHLFGPMQEQIHLPDWVVYHGPVSPDELISEWFPNACGLITLSQHDEGRPQIMLEAMAAGIPVIASPLDAHTDIIEHGKTGCISRSTEEFDEAIRLISDPVKNLDIGKRAKKWIRENIGTWDDCANRFIKIYDFLLREEKNEQ